MKHIRRSAWVLLCLILCAALAGCASKTEVPDRTRSEAVTAFLKEFFTFNKDGRWDVFDEAARSMQPEQSETGIAPLPEEVQAAFAEAYEPLHTMVTEELYSKLTANRLPSKYDKLVSEAGLTAEIADMQTSYTPGGTTYEFEITYQSDEVTALVGAPLKGQVTVRTEGEAVLIASISFS